MALQIVADPPAKKHDRGAATDEIPAPLHPFDTTFVAESGEGKGRGATDLATGSEASDGSQEQEKPQGDVGEVSDSSSRVPDDTSAGGGAEPEAAASDATGEASCAAADTSSPTPAPVARENLTSGKDDGGDAGVAVARSIDETPVGETLALSTSSGVRSGSFSSTTCDGTPPSRTSNDSTCSLNVLGLVTLTSPLNRHVDVPSCSSSSPSRPDARRERSSEFVWSHRSDSSLNSGGMGITGTLTGASSASGDLAVNTCNSSFGKGLSSCSGEGSRFESGLYRSHSGSATMIKAGGCSEGHTISRGNSSSSSASTRVSLDSTLLGYENSRTTDGSSSGSFEDCLGNEKSESARRPPPQPVEAEPHEPGLLQSRDRLAFLDFSARSKKLEKGNSLDRCVTMYRGGTMTNSPFLHEVEGLTQDDLVLSHNNSAISRSSRRRSSSCSVSGKESGGRRRLVAGHTRLMQPHNEKDAGQPSQEKTIEEERWACGTRDGASDSTREREKVDGDRLCKGASAVIKGASPHGYAADAQVKSESVFLGTTTKQTELTDEFEYISKKSCLGLELGGWSDRQRLSSKVNDGTREGVVPGGDSCLRNVCTSPRLFGGELMATQDPEPTVRVLTRSLSSGASSQRGGAGAGNRDSSLFGLDKGLQQQQQHHTTRSKNVLSRPLHEDVGLPRSPARTDIRTAKALGEDRKTTGERGGTTGRSGSVAERSSGGSKETLLCKREDRWTSPFPGVKYCRSRNAWIARWSESGQEKWKTFPVKDSSFEEARRRALEFRQEKDRRKFERLWQQLNAEGLTTGSSSSDIRNSVLSPGCSKLSGSDSSSGEGNSAGGRALENGLAGEQTIVQRKDVKSASGWQQQNEEGADDMLATPRLADLSAFRSTRLLQHNAHLLQQRKQDTQQRQQLQEITGQDVFSSEASGTELFTKNLCNPSRPGGSNSVDSLGSGRVWLTPGVHADPRGLDIGFKNDEALSPAYFRDGRQQRNPGAPAHLQLLDSLNMANNHAEPGWSFVEDQIRRELAGAGTPKTPGVASSRQVVSNSIGEKLDVPAGATNGPSHQQQQFSPSYGVAPATQAAAAAAAVESQGLPRGRVVEALLDVLSGDDGNFRKEGLCPERLAFLLGEHGRLQADALGRLPPGEIPVSRKRRSRDEDTLYAGSESTSAESVTPSSLKILGMYKSALLLIMDDLMSNGLPLLIASGGGAPLGTDFRHLPHVTTSSTPSSLGETEVQPGDRKTRVEQSMRKMLEDQRKCIEEASLLGAVSPFVKLFETCILDQKLPSQADESGRTQLVYLNALSALQELSLSVKGGNSVVW